MEADGDIRARRLGDVDHLVRQWADEGEVRRDVAARFLVLGEWQRRRRIWTWAESGAPRRRRDEVA